MGGRLYIPSSPCEWPVEGENHMAYTATTLTAAITATDTVFALASTTNITAPNFTTGSGVYYLKIENEYMLVTGVSSLVVTVQRGVQGTYSAAHAATAPVLYGIPTDFGVVVPPIKAVQDA